MAQQHTIVSVSYKIVINHKEINAHVALFAFPNEPDEI